MRKTRHEKRLFLCAAIVFLLPVLGACSQGADAVSDNATGEYSGNDENPTEYEIMENGTDGEHVIEADGKKDGYEHIRVIKTGDSEGDEADFYGANSAIFATNNATLELNDIQVETDGTHANAVFSYGEGTTVNIGSSVIETKGNCSGGLMTTGGGTMNAQNLLIHTEGNSSAAIRSDRGGGIVNVEGGAYTTDGTGSPVIYSTADITVSDAELKSNASQGVVVEGKNSVTLNNVNMQVNNIKKNSDKSDHYQAVMLYQSMSGDAGEGTASFTMNGGKLENFNEDVFFINNTAANIYLKDAEIRNNGGGIFLRAEAAGWGSEGSNGGHVNLNADSQDIIGDISVDEVSQINIYLKNGSVFEGAINQGGEAGDVYVELDNDSVWKLTGDSYISSLTCDSDSIDLNGYSLYIDGQKYTGGTIMTGEPVEFDISSREMGGPGGTPPDGNGGPGGTPPDGNGGPGGTPPDGNGAAPLDGSSSADGNSFGGESDVETTGAAPGGTPPDGNGGPGGTPPDGTFPGDGQRPAPPSN